MRHAALDVADASPGVEPGAERVERAIVRGHRAPGESECCPQEPAALVEHALLDDLVRPQQQRLRDVEPERLRGLQIDDEVELCRLLHGQVCRLGALQDSVNVDCSTSFHLGSIYSIGHEATWLDEILELIDCGDPVRGRKIDDRLSMHEHKSRRRHQYTLVVILPHAAESGSEFPRSVHDERMNLYAEGPRRGSGLLIVPSA